MNGRLLGLSTPYQRALVASALMIKSLIPDQMVQYTGNHNM